MYIPALGPSCTRLTSLELKVRISFGQQGRLKLTARFSNDTTSKQAAAETVKPLA
jgi:hypothetical protein